MYAESPHASAPAADAKATADYQFWVEVAERKWHAERARMREQIEAVEQEKRQLTLDRERLASRIAAVEEKPQTSPGPARWELNTPFTDYLTALSRRLADHLPSSRHDREKLADRAKVSITTIEKLLRAEGNSTIHTLYSIANARGLRLSTLFEETERELEAARSRHKPPAR